jgi:localization factor PodJL
LARADVAPPPVALQRRPPAPSEPDGERLPPLTGAPPPRRRAIADPPAGGSPDKPDLSIEQAVAEITARQRVLDGEAQAAPAVTGPTPAAPPPSSLSSAPPENRPTRTASQSSESAPAPPLDLSGLERQLRQITTRIEALRPASDLETAIKALRSDLVEIGRSLTEALPRRAVESLEIEIKALGQRIDHSRQSGVDSTALANLEHGLADVRQALRGLTTAESLVGVDEAVKGLTQKFDVIAAKEDPAALQQLEAAIGGLRGIVSHVASNDALTKVAEDVRSLAAKVDGLANNAASGHAITALENRIDTLATALNASAEAGHAVPRELEKLLAGLIEKLEWVQLTHTDHAALAHLEDRIATLVKRFDTSDARFVHLEAVERGIADLLVHIEQVRGIGGKAEGGNKAKPIAVDAIKRDVAEIKQIELRTQDSLEVVQGTVEHVVDRLAMIESDMRGDKTKAVPSELPAASAPVSVQMPAAAVLPLATPQSGQAETTAHRATAARRPIDPNLPPDHPLEPGSAAGRSRPPSAADRIAASEAAVGSKPPVIPDPGGKPDFIAAARRAAQAAVSALPDHPPGAAAAAAGAPLPKKLTQRLRKLIVAVAVVVIVVGCFHIATRLFEDGGSAVPEARTEKPSIPPAAPPEANPTKLLTPDTNPLPVPGNKPAANGDVPPGATPGATTGAKPGRQSLLHDAAAPPTIAAELSPADKPANGSVIWSTPDITGSLQRQPASQSIATASPPEAVALGDKLPAAIGGPALRAAALSGDPSAAYEVAVRFAEGRGVPQNSEEAARWLDRAAKKGLAPAQFRLGGLYEKGVGVKKDLAAARDLYRAAADQGHGKAMHNLAVLYAEGIDGASDYRSAAEWFRKAADHGITDSQYNLGILYARGIGVERNFAESYKWFSLAANQGDKDAAKKRDEVAAHLDQPSLAAARLAVQNWKPEPQPADAITVKVPGTSEPPATPASRPKPHSARIKPPASDAAKID